MTVYTDGMEMDYRKFKTKKEAIEYLESLGYKECRRIGRKVGFEVYSSYAEVVPIDELKVDEVR